MKIALVVVYFGILCDRMPLMFTNQGDTVINMQNLELSAVSDGQYCNSNSNLENIFLFAPVFVFFVVFFTVNHEHIHECFLKEFVFACTFSEIMKDPLLV